MIKAVQQFQLGTVLNTKEQVLETFRRMKAAGYDGIELCSFMIHPTPFVVKLLTKAAGMPVGNGGKLPWKELIHESGMKVPAIHTYLNAIEENPVEVAEEAHSFGCDTVVMTGMYRFDYTKKENVIELARRLNEAGKKLAENGVQLLYHNHNAEFLLVEPGISAYHLLQEETDVSYVNFEFDSYWCVDAGADALGEMKRLGSRMKLWHINDRGCRKGGMTPIYKMDSMELGFGTMNLELLAEQAKTVGVAAVILESHKNWIEKDPVKSLEKSAAFFNRMFKEEF